MLTTASPSASMSGGEGRGGFPVRGVFDGASSLLKLKVDAVICLGRDRIVRFKEA